MQTFHTWSTFGIDLGKVGFETTNLRIGLEPTPPFQFMMAPKSRKHIWHKRMFTGQPCEEWTPFLGETVKCKQNPIGEMKRGFIIRFVDPRKPPSGPEQKLRVRNLSIQKKKAKKQTNPQNWQGFSVLYCRLPSINLFGKLRVGFREVR